MIKDILNACFFILACAIHNCSCSIKQFLYYPTSPFLKPPPRRSASQPPTNAERRWWETLVLSEFGGAAVVCSAQRPLLPHGRLTSHSAFLQQGPEEHEFRVHGIPQFSPTSLCRSWRTLPSFAVGSFWSCIGFKKPYMSMFMGAVDQEARHEWEVSCESWGPILFISVCQQH